MESPIELVRRFCAAWSANADVAELAGFFADDAVYHNIPLAPIIVRAASDGDVRDQGRQDHRLARLFRHEPVHHSDGIELDVEWFT